MLWGAHDPYIPVAYASRQREVFPDARIVILDGSGHWPFADDPSAVAAAVVPFLREQLGGEETPSQPRVAETTGDAKRRAPREAEMRRDHAIVVGASMGGLLAASELGLRRAVFILGAGRSRANEDRPDAIQEMVRTDSARDQDSVRT